MVHPHLSFFCSSFIVVDDDAKINNNSMYEANIINCVLSSSSLHCSLLYDYDIVEWCIIDYLITLQRKNSTSSSAFNFNYWPLFVLFIIIIYNIYILIIINNIIK